jgi:hypothetical protein
MRLCVFALIASEFMPVSLLTPMTADLRVSDGFAGQRIPISGAFKPCSRLRPTQRGCLRALGLVLGVLVLDGCKASEAETPGAVPQDAATTSAQPEEHRMWMTVGKRRFAITLVDTDAARAFAAQLPLTLDMAELNGNEKHADLAQALPKDASRPGTIHNGDLMLYGSNTLVVFYETFRSSYSYTRLGHVNDPASLGQVLGKRSIRVVFTND